MNAPRLKVLHVISGLRRGGAEAVLARLVAASATEFEHVVVSLRDQGHFGPILRRQGVPVHAIELDRMWHLPARLRALVRIMRNVRPDLVQTWLYHADVLGGLAARRAGVPAVLWGIRNTNLDVASIGRSLRWIARLGARLSRSVPDAIVCNSEHAARVHAEFGYCEPSFRIVFNGYDTAKFKPDMQLRAAARHEFRVADDETLIGKMARWDPQKDHDNLLTALTQLRGPQSEIRALLAGEGMVPENEPLMAMIRRAGLQNRIILAGARDDVPTLMNGLDLHVMASLGEAFPNAVAEAMACGTPCVVTDVGDAARIVGDTGWIVPARNSPALAAAIERGLQALARDGRQALASRCRRRIEEHYPLPGMVAAYGALWREFGGKGRIG